MIAVFDSPLAEYKTRKAAERFTRRIIGGGIIKKSATSAFDMYWPKGKPVYQVFKVAERDERGLTCTRKDRGI